MIEDFEKKQLEKKKDQQAGADTAQAIGKAAATASAGVVGNKAFDAVANTKTGQAALNTAGKVIAKTPGLNKLSRKASDSGLTDAANAVSDASSGRVGSAVNNLNKAKNKNSLNRNKKNLNNDEVPNALKNRSHNLSARNRYLNNTNNVSSQEETENNEETEENYEQEEPSILSGSAKNKILIARKMVPVIAIGAGFLLVLMIVIIFFGNIISGFESVFGLFYHDTENSDYVYNDNSEMSEKEKKYYDQINEVVDEYRSKYGVVLDKILLQTVLEYKYTGVNVDDMYTDAELDDDAESEFEENLENLGEDSENSVDYNAMKKKIKTVASLMIEKNGSRYTTDTKVDGVFYNKLIESRFFKSYYKDLLKDNEYETRKALVDEIWEYYELAKEIVIENNYGAFASSNIQVYLQTCNPATPYYYKTIDGIKVFNNPSATGNYPKSLSLTDYLKGVIFGEMQYHILEENKEYIKAQMIASLTFAIRHETSGFDLKTGEMYMPNGDCKQVCCDPNIGGDYRYDGYKYGSCFTTPNGNHPPLSEEKHEFLDSLLNEVFGLVMVKKGITPETFVGSSSIASSAGNFLATCNPGTCLSQTGAVQDAQNGMTYIEILNKYYANVDSGNGFDLINIKEGLYWEEDGTIYNGAFKTEEKFHYYQNYGPWANVKLCGSGEISSNGCNITATAMAISLLTNQEITPLTLNNRQNAINSCNANSRPQMIMDFTKLYGLSATPVLKDNKAAVSDMLEKLASGNYVVVARFAPNESKHYRTSSGHYVTIVGVRNQGGNTQVLVWDPIGRNNPNRDNYWADLKTDILPYLRDEYSFIVIGRN